MRSADERSSMLATRRDELWLSPLALLVDPSGSVLPREFGKEPSMVDRRLSRNASSCLNFWSTSLGDGDLSLGVEEGEPPSGDGTRPRTGTVWPESKRFPAIQVAQPDNYPWHDIPCRARPGVRAVA